MSNEWPVLSYFCLFTPNRKHFPNVRGSSNKNGWWCCDVINPCNAKTCCLGSLLLARCWPWCCLLLNIGVVSNETSTDVHMYTLLLILHGHITICGWHAVQSWSKILKGIYISLYTNIWIDWRTYKNDSQLYWSEWGETALRQHLTHSPQTELQLNRELSHWDPRSVKCHSDVCFVPSTLWCQLVTQYTLNFSNCCRNN